MKDYWFIPKKYGYGAYPANWKGWTFVAVFVLLAALLAIRMPNNYLGFGLLVVLAIIISHKKTKGDWKWRWG